jgi:hypothetical protein
MWQELVVGIKELNVLAGDAVETSVSRGRQATVRLVDKPYPTV